ncbi:MAG: acyl-CoA dehydrogenase, partial [Gammaproteobacteria bacterium]|nr:acyl-CoA dehydrogenase [Gammaproteobacteria bacterium]
MMDLGLSEELVEVREKIRIFVAEKVEPVELEYHEEVSVGDRWSHTPRQDEIMESLKAEARRLGLWNFFLPESQGGAG